MILAWLCRFKGPLFLYWTESVGEVTVGHYDGGVVLEKQNPYSALISCI